MTGPGVPVTPAQMAAEARDAFNAGASIMHVHVRNQEDGMGHLPSWDPEVMAAVVDAIAATVTALNNRTYVLSGATSATA